MGSEMCIRDRDGSGDLLAAIGDTNLDGLTLQVADAAFLDQSKVYTIVTCTGDLTGAFAATNLDSPWRVSYDYTAGTAKIAWIPAGTLILVK